jgi:hypothetical protein
MAAKHTLKEGDNNDDEKATPKNLATPRNLALSVLQRAH